MCALLRSLLALLASLLALLRSLIALLRSLLALLACSAPVAAGNSHKALAYFSRLQVAFLTHLLDVRICTLVPVSEYFCTSKASAFLTHLLDVSICTFVPAGEYFCTSKASAFLTHLLDACTPSVYQQQPRQRRLKKKKKKKKRASQRAPAAAASATTATHLRRCQHLHFCTSISKAAFVLERQAQLLEHLENSHMRRIWVSKHFRLTSKAAFSLAKQHCTSNAGTITGAPGK
jgi:hypothetical protein